MLWKAVLISACAVVTASGPVCSSAGASYQSSCCGNPQGVFDTTPCDKCVTAEVHCDAPQSSIQDGCHVESCPNDRKCDDCNSIMPNEAMPCSVFESHKVKPAFRDCYCMVHYCPKIAYCHENKVSDCLKFKGCLVYTPSGELGHFPPTCVDHITYSALQKQSMIED